MIFSKTNRVVYYESYPLVQAKVPPAADSALQKQKWVHLFIDEVMMVKEKKDFVHRMNNNPQTCTKEAFQGKLNDFGSFAVITNQQAEAETIFQYYKSRVGVEVLYNVVIDLPLRP